MNDIPREVPLRLQDPLSIVAVGDSRSPVALRAVLDSFNYLVEMHWVGSRKQLVEILAGRIPTHRYVVIDCHGDPDGLVIPEEPMLTPSELNEVVNLPKKTVVAHACYGGREEFAQAFLQGSCEAYVGPVDAVAGNSALLFVIHLFYLLSIGQRLPLEQAVEKARGYDTQGELFQLYTK